MHWRQTFLGRERGNAKLFIVVAWEVDVIFFSLYGESSALKVVLHAYVNKMFSLLCSKEVKHIEIQYMFKMKCYCMWAIAQHAFERLLRVKKDTA